MAISNVFQTGKTGMMTAKAGIATTGHNISNTGTEGYSRQRVLSEANVSKQMTGSGGPYVGEGAKLARIERVNDHYIEKQLQQGNREVSYHEERQVFLGQVEDVFNEMNGDGLNRLVAKFFNDFRKLANEPSSEAIRRALQESSQAMINDFRRIRNDTESVRAHIDSRIDGYMKELNSYSKELGHLNLKIHDAEVSGHEANDLRDRRDLVLKRMGSYVDISTSDADGGMINVAVKGVGPLVTGPNVESFHIARQKAVAEDGSVENSLQIGRSPYSTEYVTQQFKSGKIGALVETRDKNISSVLARLDELAHSVSSSVNELHQKGFTLDGKTNVNFFEPIDGVTGAAQRISLSDSVKESPLNIAIALQPDSPSDNRNALAIANLQNFRMMDGGNTTVDDFYNSIVSEVGVVSARNNEALGQQRGILTQLNKIREQVSGVSIDEETANLMQFQHAFDASARVIRTADEMLDTILKLRG